MSYLILLKLHCFQISLMGKKSYCNLHIIKINESVKQQWYLRYTWTMYLINRGILTHIRQEQGMDETEKSDNSVLVLYFHIY